MTELKPNRPLESIINEANEIIEQTKKGELDRGPRMDRLTELCDDLALTAEEYRNKDNIYALIERLTNALLHEELTDPTPWKSQQSEYPVYSENMLDKKSQKNVPQELASEYGMDRKNHGRPVRRKRTKSELAFADRTVKSRERARKASYRAFVQGEDVPVRLRVSVK
ncbi:hypothetical protein BLD48_05825 [Exiguobacterium sp. KRL4]|uniref:hypothetical protein n=1 Tax=Exiguobacterium sp. KRL4 TaxID=1914536 RepID=UPI0008F8606D|nr:hypothetical protein [Exiguobacterium sp. KRL4]OIN67407.1 hypothetical protein BLD48_05825 [Exiguobacterium sp. KRL4]